MQLKRVAVLRGGPSAEYDISLSTGAGVLESLRKQDYFAKDIVVSKAGEWLHAGVVRDPEKILSDIDVVFLALHGPYGEDGTVQRILDRLHIPYTGSGPFASSLAMNKFLAKEHLRELGFKLPQHMRLRRDGVSNINQTVYGISQMFGPRYVIKPTNGGSSLDTFMADDSGALKDALDKVFANYEDVLVEERISGREATVGVLEDFRESRFNVLPVVEIVPPVGYDFFAAEVKYTGETEEICPGRFSSMEKEFLKQAALDIHKTLNLHQYSRSDFMVNPEGIYFLEVNTLPGLTPNSLFPKSIDAIGSSYDELIQHLVETAVVG